MFPAEWLSYLLLLLKNWSPGRNSIYYAIQWTQPYQVGPCCAASTVIIRVNCRGKKQERKSNAFTLRRTWKANGKLQNRHQNTSWSTWINVKQKYWIYFFGALLKSSYFVKFRSGNPSSASKKLQYNAKIFHVIDCCPAVNDEFMLGSFIKCVNKLAS